MLMLTFTVPKNMILSLMVKSQIFAYVLYSTYVRQCLGKLCPYSSMTNILSYYWKKKKGLSKQ